jgi:hypothetical protein
MFLWGSAAKTAADLLKQAGFDLIMPPESLLVKGMKEPHLDEGEEEHAKTWAIQLGKRADYPGTRVMIGQ